MFFFFKLSNTFWFFENFTGFPFPSFTPSLTGSSIPLRHSERSFPALNRLNQIPFLTSTTNKFLEHFHVIESNLTRSKNFFHIITLSQIKIFNTILSPFSKSYSQKQKDIRLYFSQAILTEYLMLEIYFHTPLLFESLFSSV